MRHRRKSRVLGRSPSHRKALLKNLASALFLTERDAELDDNAPKVPGRIVTTLAKAKEVRPLVEKCVTIAKKSLASARDAEKYAAPGDRGSEEYRRWRQSDDWQKWAAARAPEVNGRRRVLQLIGDKQAVAVLFDRIAERFEDRPGGYTRIVRLAAPRLGDAGTQAILEFVGKNDRIKKKSVKPAFAEEPTDESEAGEPVAAESAAGESGDQQRAPESASAPS